MTNGDQNLDAAEAGAHAYLYLSLGALLLLLLMLLRLGLGMWSLVPVLAGVLGVGFQWRGGPFLTLFFLGATLYGHENLLHLAARMPRGVAFRGPISLPDWILCGAVLAYLAAHYRLQALTHSVFPVEGPWRAMERQGAPGPAAAPRSDPKAATSVEVSWLILGLPIWAFLGQLCWRLLPAVRRDFGLPWYTMRGILLVWIIALGFFLVAGVVAFLADQRMKVQEARLFLQDLLWREMHGEQRRVSRRLAWCNIRRRRRERT